jgi:hypothetical protein
METITRSMTSYLYRLSRELGDVAQQLDGTGWVLVSAALLVCGWMFLKGNKIKST